MAEAATKAKKAYLGTGRRKTAVARVRMFEGGSGQVTINGRAVEEFFTEDKDRNAVYGPLELCEVRSRVDVTVKVHGGGITGQAGAVCQGLARALKEMFNLPTEAAPAPEADGQTAEAPGSSMAKKLRDSGYLTRDDRKKERKKYGRKGARKSFQFSKR